MRIIKNMLQAIAEKVSKKSCKECYFCNGIFCTRKDEIGEKCREGIKPVGFYRNEV